MEWMFMPLRRYAEFSGRSRRLEFWMFGLFNLIVYAALFAIAIGMGWSLTSVMEAGRGNPLALYSAFFSGPGLIMAVWWLVVLVPTIAVTVRRFHDRDMSGWWYLGFIVANFIPVVNFVSGIALLVIMLMAGTPGPNRFGADPKDPTGGAEVFS